MAIEEKLSDENLTFKDIFGHHAERVIVPIIQRDYAQGRKDNTIQTIRDEFLSSLKEAVNDNPIKLDFIYGDIDGLKIMHPLDGQQRLTTLFLLYWYVSRKESIPLDECSFLQKFSYETRYSARDFCKKLTNEDFFFSFNDIVTIGDNASISDFIKNQSWFPYNWENDPTIDSMLVMIDAIDKNFRDIDDIWNKLDNITFDFLSIKNMGLTDELYIKMNSRGKPLTRFENFKAKLENNIRMLFDAKRANDIAKKIDNEWTNFLWGYCKENYNEPNNKLDKLDNYFLRYFKFICDVICYKDKGTSQDQNYNELNLLRKYFSIECNEFSRNLKLLEDMYDCLCDNTLSPKDIFNECISIKDFENDKILFSNERTDLLEDCFNSYSDMVGNTKRRVFSLSKFVLLYSFIVYFLDGKSTKSINKDEFKKRLRIINNLIRNSEYEISDSTSRSGGNRMPAIIEQVDNIIKLGKIDKNISANFNKNQINEEIDKLEWLNINKDKYYDLCKIENHNMLYGSIAIVGIENINADLISAFESLFQIDDRMKIDSALLCMGDYSQHGKYISYHEFGGKTDSSWRNLFHKSEQREHFDRTKDSIIKVLSRISTSNRKSSDILDEIIKEFIKKCESDKLYDWRYYYIKYRESFSYAYGMNYWENFEEEPYVMITMTTSSNLSINCYDPYLQAVDAEHRLKKWWSTAKFGTRLVYGNKHIVSTNDGFEILERDADDNDKFLESITVEQNEKKIDKQDRIEILKKYIEDNGLKKNL